MFQYTNTHERAITCYGVFRRLNQGLIKVFLEFNSRGINRFRDVANAWIELDTLYQDYLLPRGGLNTALRGPADLCRLSEYIRTDPWRKRGLNRCPDLPVFINTHNNAGLIGVTWGRTQCGLTETVYDMFRNYERPSR